MFDIFWGLFCASLRKCFEIAHICHQAQNQLIEWVNNSLQSLFRFRIDLESIVSHATQKLTLHHAIIYFNPLHNDYIHFFYESSFNYHSKLLHFPKKFQFLERDGLIRISQIFSKVYGYHNDCNISHNQDALYQPRSWQSAVPDLFSGQHHRQILGIQDWKEKDRCICTLRNSYSLSVCTQLWQMQQKIEHRCLQLLEHKLTVLGQKAEVLWRAELVSWLAILSTKKKCICQTSFSGIKSIPRQLTCVYSERFAKFGRAFVNAVT